MILFVVSWSVYEMIPLSARNLLVYFQERAQNRDTNFANIVARAQELERAQAEAKETPRTFQNLQAAIGTNLIASYFPHIRSE